jgi:Zn-dependent protease with chaperone function
MDFFTAQERARTLSGWLIALFGLAVVLIVLTVYAVLALVLLQGEMLWDAGLFLATAVAIGVVIAGASTVRSAGLRSGGGAAVAEMLGGRLISAETTHPAERRLMNVVEEMALSAGTPVPSVYVLDDEGRINAFAAGYSPEDAVVGFTRGALEVFSRDELQAVAAHEFSHIVNRDIRLNIRLTGLLFGILALGLGGRLLLRATWYGGGGRRDGRATAALAATGVALFVTGYLGVFLGRIIRAGVSRQREFLADAAAVQWTRNPEGMAGALKKIGAMGSRLETASAEEVSHFFFANGLRSGLFSGLWSTHPPLKDRVRRIEPSFDGDFSRVRLDSQETEVGPRGRPSRRGHAAGSAHPAAAIAAGLVGVAAIESEISTGSGDGARDLHSDLRDIPETLLNAAHEPLSAVALMYAVMLDRDPTAREPQLKILDQQVISHLRDEVRRLLSDVDGLQSDVRLALVDVAAPALRTLSNSQAEKLMTVLSELARADHRLSIFEFALTTAVRHRLAASHGKAGKSRHWTLSGIEQEVRLVLTALAMAGQGRPEMGRAAYRAGLRVLDLSEGGALPACTAEDLQRALQHLSEATPRLRQQIVAACAATTLHDRTVRAEELYLLRAVAAALDAPLPASIYRAYQDAPRPEVAA